MFEFTCRNCKKKSYSSYKASKWKCIYCGAWNIDKIKFKEKSKDSKYKQYNDKKI